MENRNNVKWKENKFNVVESQKTKNIRRNLFIPGVLFHGF